MPSILLATDLTPWCDRAKERALWLARRDGVPLHILHVADDEQAGQKAGEDIAAMLADEAVGLDVRLTVTMGAVWEEIARAARASQAGLVIMGRHRPDALRDFFLSPTATQVRAGTAILQAVNLHVGPWHHVLAGCDCSASSRHAVSVGADLAREADVHLIHAFEMPFAGFITNPADLNEVAERNRQALEQEVKVLSANRGMANDRLHPGLARGAVVPALVAEAGRLDADLLVIGAGGHGGRHFGSTARALTVDPPCDLLVVW